jgi:hypothetical protein
VSDAAAALGRRAARPTAEAVRTGVRARSQLVVASCLMLFVELALIRWTAENNLHLAYVQNFVLLASFLGIGVGFLRADRQRDLLAWSPVVLAVLVALVLAFPVSLTTFSGSHGLRGGFGIPPLPSWVSLPAIFLLSAAVLVGLGHRVARLFRLFPPLEAYRLDIVGSLAGIGLFSSLSFFDAPPVAWGLIAAVGFAALLGRRIRWWSAAALVAVVAVLAVESMAAHDHWSPYYKITAVQPAGTHGVLVVAANNIPHQTAYPLATLHRIERFYFFPYRHVSTASLDHVLIVGAGTGNDVAAALAAGARHLDAVEIDPVLQRLGAQVRVDHAYQDPRVSVHIDDGRAYLERTSRRYNLIFFALPDSLTLLPGQGNLRLENYLFTLESMRTVRAHLAPGGTFAMYNYYEPFLLDRYAATIKKVFGASPCVELGDTLAGRQQAVLTIRSGGPVPNCRTLWHGTSTDLPTDDHPFPYLASRTIPSFYLWTLGLILAASLIAVRTAAGPLRRMSGYLDLAFMGGAFLLLETKNIVQFALLFGTTWIVNSIVFAGVLLSVLAAIEVTLRLPLPRPVLLYAALLIALAVAWLVPQASLLALSLPFRLPAATALAFAPIFLANLVFAQRLQDSESSTTAFGANLLGAMIGGALEYLALITGYRVLLLVVGLLYALAALTGRRTLQRPSTV